MKSIKAWVMRRRNKLGSSSKVEIQECTDFMTRLDPRQQLEEVKEGNLAKVGYSQYKI